jgi:hypothetical protein
MSGPAENLAIARRYLKAIEAGASGGEMARVSLISSQWPRWRQTYGLRAILSEEHLNSAHSTPRKEHHKWDTGRRIFVWA